MCVAVSGGDDRNDDMSHRGSQSGRLRGMR